MKKSFNRGFTLIELLVVIAVIGILASVVLASLNSARTKGRVANVKANLRSAVSQAEIYYSENGSYTGVCSNTTIQSIVTTLGSAACYDSAGAVTDQDWGIATVLDGTYYTAGPSGVITLDATDVSGTQTWSAAMSACSNAGKRLPGFSQLNAVYFINNAVPSGFSSSANGYWSSTVPTNNPTSACLVNMGSGGACVNGGSQTIAKHVRCGF